jgi:mRNA interferase MazF
VRTPSEGDVVVLDDEGATGHEQRGKRPALVVSISKFQETGYAMACPITTHGGRASRPSSGFEVPIPPGFAVTGFILTQQLRTFDWRARRADVVDHLPRATLLQVRARLKLFLGL